MLHLTTSNRTECLLEALAAALQTEREAFGPWEPFRLVVPNPNVRRWLLDHLSRRLGILANADIGYLDSLWKGAFEGEKPPVRIWNRRAIQGAILSVLAEPGVLEDPDLAPLKDYLAGGGADLKLLQLSERAAGLLEDYTLARPDWIRAWEAGRLASGAPERLERWQRALWRRITEAVRPTGLRWTTLAQEVRSGALARMALPPRLHVFGLSYMAEVYHRAFEAAAQRAEIHLYSLNPCEELWDDLRTEAEARRVGFADGAPGPDEASEDPFRLDEAAEPLLLRRWGRPARENVRLLHEISGFDFTPAFPEASADSQLAALQAGLQRREGGSGIPADGSVKLMACPNPAREAEAVATEIWRLMEAAPKDRPLRFSDIAVVVPPDETLRRTYLEHLRTAFDATGRIPMVAVDAPGSGAAMLLDGAELLLDLPLGRCSRRDLLRALTHPAVLSRFPDLEPGAWPAWAEAAGIVRGLDPGDLADEAETDPQLLHWEQGLQRLALSAFLPADATWSGPDFERPSLAVGSPEAVGPFVARAGSLSGWVRRLRDAHVAPGEWALLLQGYLLGHLGGDDAAEVRARNQLARGLERLGALVPEGLPEPRLSYRQARFLADQALRGVRDESAGRPHQGVVAGSYAPMRALPFRAVFLMGLGEGLFPAVEDRDPLDLRAARRRAGDVGPAERDRHLVLKMVLGAREVLRLTYPTEDPVSRERRLPSSLVMDLALALNPEAPDPTTAMAFEAHARDRFDPRHAGADPPPPLPSYADAAPREAAALAAGTRLRAAGHRPGPSGLAGLELPGPWPSRLEALVRQCPAPSAPPRPEAVTVSLSLLRTWLECPVQGLARLRLGLRADGEDPAMLEEEPLASSVLVRTQLRRQAVMRAAREGVDLESAYLAARREAERSGLAPPGIFGRAERLEDLEVLHLLRRALGGARPRLLRFGPDTGLGEEADEVRPALRLDLTVDGRPVQASLVGTLQPQVEHRGAACALFLDHRCGLQAKGGATPSFRLKVLRAYLDQHLLAAAGEEEIPYGALSAAAFDDKGDDPGPFRGHVPLKGLSPEAALARLAQWLQEMLDPAIPGLLPIQDALDDTVLEGPAALQDSVLRRAQDDRDFSTFRTGPLPRAERFPIDPDPAATAGRRLGDFLAQSESGHREGAP